MSDIRIFNLDAGSYLRMTPEKSLAKSEKEKKDLYLQAFLERRRTFTPMVYSKLCGFVQARMSLAIVRSNSLLLRGPREKGARICQRPDMTDGVAMPLLAPWRG